MSALRSFGLASRGCAPILLAFAVLCCVCPGIYAQAAPAPTPPATPSAAQEAAADLKLNGARLTVGGDVEKPLSLSLLDLSGLPRQILKVINEHEGKEETYQGVPLAEILKRAGVPQGSELRGAAFAMYVRAEGADGYSVVFSLAE